MARGSPGEPRQKHHGDVPDGYIGYYLVPDMPKANQPVPPRPDQPLLQLRLQVGEPISFNERHAVYDVKVIRAEPDTFYVPPLVIKVAQTDEAGQLLPKEAAMYEHIRTLQGVVAPRFYGYFHVANPRSEWTHVPTSKPVIYDDYEDCPFPADGSDVMPAPEGPPPCTRMDVLLLEKVGKHLPPGQMSDKLIVDLRRMYHDLSSLHVDHFDYRPANVTYAPESPPGLPGLPSPFRSSGKCVYGLRIIDFEGAQITTRTPLYQRKLIKQRLPGLIWGLMAS
ncbi:hypothetical protein L227DRAFT_643061 [Lentinus tigrinus ALCF2SS1-6]|uniref:Protein kinase domain-containing protein n=1 Tax=Lentinus tigrinus ALCF2SS1-6 TaxID=1328759 RepID=A0A5C2SJY5_9APHY|nr:hypothetical protein L227DRAFT_643061 [Lentinus tigrinus ALCF2SS1-6]